MDIEDIEDESNVPVKTDFTVNPDGSITVDEITIPSAPQPALTVEAIKERLIITGLVVEDFKSYAGNHIIGPFNKNFSCIVGPNGSGKSNVIDALLFVFGYRAQKIRSKKISVLIHKSHKFPDLQSCSVKVNFVMIKDEGKDFTCIPDSEFSVKRTGYSDNTSTYEINGKRSQYRDVASLLRGYGIDLDYNRFMILQGEIELISMMKPKAPTEQDSGMLEYIEDIIGSNRFIKPIEHFNAKGEAMNELRLEKLNQLKVIEKERADAEKPRNKAMEYMHFANKVTLMKNSAVQAQLHAAIEEENVLNDSRKLLVEKLDAASASMEEVQIEKDLKESEFKDLMAEYEKIQKIVEELKNLYTNLERQDVACRENIKNCKEKLKKLAKTLETEEAKIPVLKKKLTTLEGEVVELEEKKKVMEKAKAAEEEKLNEVMGSLKEEIQGFQEEKDEFESQLVKRKSVVAEKKSELNLAENELELVLSAENKAKETLESLQTEYEKNMSSLREEKNALKEAQKKLPEIEKELISSQKKYAELEKKENDLSEEVKIKRIKLEELTSSLSASENRNALVKAFMEQKSKGKLTGVLGRLGDLGAIDAKYDVAISTACAPLDNIVTDVMTTAQDCIKFLKETNLGYSTFIPLEKMEKWIPYTQQKITTPENVPRLFDLVTVKNKDILPAFYFALKDTLVAKDLEQATRVGLQGSSRYRVVTLKGELIDLSGTMTGGGGGVMKGRMGQCIAEDSSLSQKDIKQLTEDIENLTQEIVNTKKLRQELKETISRLEKEIPKLHHNLKKSTSNHDAYEEHSKLLASQIEEQKKKVKLAAPDKNKIKELESQIENKRKNFTEATQEAAVIEKDVKRLQDKILAVTKGKIGAVQKKVDNLTKEVNGVAENIVKSKNLIKKAAKELKKAEDKVISVQEEIETCKASREKLAAEFDELGKNGIEAVAKRDEAMKELEVFEGKKKILSRETQELSGKVHEMKSGLIELKNKVKLIDIEIKGKKGRTQSLKSQLEKLELYEVDDNESNELPTLSVDDISDVNVNSIYIEIGRLEEQMKGMNPDFAAVAEYKKKDQMYKDKQKDLDDTVAQRDHFKQHYDRLRKCRLDEFMKGFTIVSLKVKELYQMITLGGDAELELVDSLDPFSEGIEFSVRPLRKSWKNIRNLSGGEKTLSSLSLVFALHYYRSTPFFVMDEIDAALDYRNVSIIGSYIKECTKNAQFIVISLRENMFQLAGHLVGIYKTNNRTKNVALSPALLSRFEKLDESLRTSNKAKDKPKDTVNETAEQEIISGDKVLEQNNSPEKETQEREISLEVNEGENMENLHSTLRKSDKSPDEQSTKKSVTFDLGPSENKEDSVGPSSDDSAFE